ncbi:hypothetical protein SCUCBS95973_005984 [Sporothrix curviconia]|uniref:Phenazine biosynthesis protein n=1 Tax=Sporothrix curviconia TaxID=1260050 RepID=A0ABP0C2F5_9PEZI
MPELDFVTLDVFTTKRFAGNPLAVVHVPADTELAQDTKQTIAREFNFSETVFLHETALGENPNQHTVDIFTTDQELPFAGHPTIGTASHVLGRKSYASSSGSTALLVKAGRIPIERVDEEGPLVVRASVPHDVHIHQGRLRTAEGIDAVRALGAVGHGDPAIEAAELDAPVVSIVRGMSFVLVQLDSLAQLATVSTRSPGLDFDQLPTLLDAGPWGREEAGGHISRYYYVVTASETGKNVTDVRTRMIALQEEDPATGSAACTLASCLTLSNSNKNKNKDSNKTAGQTHRYNITQGVEMGRQSDILVEVATGADGSIDKVFLGGSAVEVTRGTISV